MSRNVVVVALACVCCSAQTALQPDQMYERIICVVPLIGKGTLEDPRRPMFTPADPIKESREKAAARVPGKDEMPDMGIIAFAAQESDDGNSAIVEFVARSRSAFTEIIKAATERQDVRVFRKTAASKAETTSELKKVRQNFDIEKFGVAVQ